MLNHSGVIIHKRSAFTAVLVSLIWLSALDAKVWGQQRTESEQEDCSFFGPCGSATLRKHPFYLEQQANVSVLEEALKSKDVQVRMQAAADLQRLPLAREKAISVLAKVAAKDASGLVRANATCSLGVLSRQAATESLVLLFLEQLKDSYANVRGCAASALEGVKRPTPEIVEALIEALDDPDPGVLAKVAGALGTMGSLAKSAVPFLEALSAKGGYPAPYADRALNRLSG